MCQFERWLCSQCQGAYVLFHFPCADHSEGANHEQERCERLISPRYCFPCSSEGWPRPRHLNIVPPGALGQWGSDQTVLTGMMRARVTKCQSGTTPKVYNMWLSLDDNGLVKIAPFPSNHPALNSESTLSHFTQHLSEPKTVVRFTPIHSEPGRYVGNWPAEAFEYTSEEKAVKRDAERRAGACGTGKAAMGYAQENTTPGYLSPSSASSLPSDTPPWRTGYSWDDDNLGNIDDFFISQSDKASSGKDSKGKQIASPTGTPGSYATNTTSNERINRGMGSSATAPTSPTATSISDTDATSVTDVSEKKGEIIPKRSSKFSKDHVPATNVVPVIPIVPITASRTASTPAGLSVAKHTTTPTASATRGAKTNEEDTGVKAKADVLKTGIAGLDNASALCEKEKNGKQKEQRRLPALYSQVVANGIPSRTASAGSLRYDPTSAPTQSQIPRSLKTEGGKKDKSIDETFATVNFKETTSGAPKPQSKPALWSKVAAGGVTSGAAVSAPPQPSRLRPAGPEGDKRDAKPAGNLTETVKKTGLEHPKQPKQSLKAEVVAFRTSSVDRSTEVQTRVEDAPSNQEAKKESGIDEVAPNGKDKSLTPEIQKELQKKPLCWAQVAAGRSSSFDIASASAAPTDSSGAPPERVVHGVKKHSGKIILKKRTREKAAVQNDGKASSPEQNRQPSLSYSNIHHGSTRPSSPP